MISDNEKFTVKIVYFESSYLLPYLLLYRTGKRGSLSDIDRNIMSSGKQPKQIQQIRARWCIVYMSEVIFVQ